MTTQAAAEANQQAKKFQFTPGAVKAATKGYQSSDLWKVPPRDLRVVDGFNVRVRDDAYAARVRAIADSMKMETGYHRDKPIAGYVAREGGEDFIVVTDGHTRLEAVLLAISEGADIPTVPVITKPNGTSMEDLTCALVTGNSGQPLTPFEVAGVCKRLINYGWEETEIAKRLGFTPSYVQSLLLLVSAPAAVRDMVATGSVSATLAIDTLRSHDATDAANLLQKGLAAAEASGKSRLTKKQLTKASVNSTTPRRAFKAPKVVFERAASWVHENKLVDDERILALLAYLAGTDVEGARKKLTAAISQPHSAPISGEESKATGAESEGSS